MSEQEKTQDVAVDSGAEASDASLELQNRIASLEAELGAKEKEREELADLLLEKFDKEEPDIQGGVSEKQPSDAPKKSSKEIDLLDQKAKDLESKLLQVEKKMTEQQAMYALNLACVQYGSEWTENEKEILEIAKENPSWNAARCMKEFRRDLRDREEERAKKEKEDLKSKLRVSTEKNSTPISSVSHQGDFRSKMEMAYDEIMGA